MLLLCLTLETQLLANAVGQNLDRNLPKMDSILDGWRGQTPCHRALISIFPRKSTCRDRASLLEHPYVNVVII